MRRGHRGKVGAPLQASRPLEALWSSAAHEKAWGCSPSTSVAVCAQVFWRHSTLRFHPLPPFRYGSGRTTSTPFCPNNETRSGRRRSRRTTRTTRTRAAAAAEAAGSEAPNGPLGRPWTVDKLREPCFHLAYEAAARPSWHVDGVAWHLTWWGHRRRQRRAASARARTHTHTHTHCGPSTPSLHVTSIRTRPIGSKQVWAPSSRASSGWRRPARPVATATRRPASWL